MRKHCLSPILAASGLALLVGSAQAATVLYQHTFDGGTGSLGLVAPDTANTGIILGADHGTSTANWVITGINTPSFTQAGLIEDDTQGQLAFNPVDGYVYTLTFNATVSVSGGGDWSGLGFADDSEGDRLFQTGVAWLIKRGNASTSSAFTDGTASNEGSTTSAASTETYRIELDTRDGSGLWDAYFYQGASSTAFATATNLGATLENSIDTIAIGSEGSTDTINSFSLVVAIPEPSSAMLVGLAGLSVLTLRRRR
ncbi:PEP-CTERM sorting domain-containing protein [Haloferula sp. A504]|uniref:PEP-CTERM sorting domain-containing protein n=1 Tax=Haloferula sp. A504 TaxID=3373601 RepID=UPI0031BD62E0|nr:PEP-CTERM sorting domain-containing protein [Verrucomicrobiaceae bacterium E54]